MKTISIGTTDTMDETLNTQQGAKPTRQPTGIGARLKAAREALNLTEKEAAARLRLNIQFIQMMENEAFDNSLPDTFVRGYLRSYARLLNLNDTEINTAIRQINLSPVQAAMTQPTTKKQNVNQLDRYLRWMSYFIISLLFVLVVTWWASHPRYNEAETISKMDAPAIPPLPTTEPTNLSIPAPAIATPPQNAVPTAPLNPVIKSSPPPAAPIKPQASNTDHSPAVEVNTNDDNDDDDVDDIY